jgi:hypothetical protein
MAVSPVFHSILTTRSDNYVHVRKDLLSPAEAKEEMLRRLTNVLPDLPAFGLVIVMGMLGATLAHCAHLSIGDENTLSLISKLSTWLLVAFGGVGSAVTIFLVAKTDTSKLIHCGLVAMLSGMAGPYLVMKSLASVGVSANLVKLDAAVVAVKTSTDQLQVALQASASETNPQQIIDILDQTGQSAATYLRVAKAAPANEKTKALADSKSQLQDTLNALKNAAAVAPQKSLITKVASEAEDAGANDIATEAHTIINTNAFLQNAARSGKVYFITPPGLSDDGLQPLVDLIKKRFSLAAIQPVVHPTREMGPGLEIVYYGDSSQDHQIAEDLTKLVDAYLKSQKIGRYSVNIRKGIPDRGVVPFQFDIHLGPDIASRLVHQSPGGR